MDEYRLDGGIVAAVMGAIGGSITVVRMMFNLAKRVDNNERDIAALKIAATHELDLIRQDIANVSQRTDKRHDGIEAKIDRLIERGNR